MTPVGNAYISYTQTSLKRNFCHKKYFLLVNLFTPSFNWSHQGADICEKKNFFSLIHLTLNVFLIFDFKHVVRDVGRKFVMEHIFCMDRHFKAQLCLWAPPCPINLTQSWYTNSDWLEPSNHLIHYRKSCVNHYTTGMTGGKTYNFWRKYRRKNI